MFGRGKKKATSSSQEKPSKKSKKGKEKSKPGPGEPNIVQPPPPQSDKRFQFPENNERYAKIKAFNFNQEKGFSAEFLESMPEIVVELKRRNWEKFNNLVQKVEGQPGNLTLVTEFFANSYTEFGSGVQHFVTIVRGVRIKWNEHYINEFLGITNIDPCPLAVARAELERTAEAGRRIIKDYVALEVECCSNSSEVQVTDAVAVKMIMEGTDFNLGFTLRQSINSMANNTDNTFTLGHCNFISAFLRHHQVPEYPTDTMYYSIKALTVGQFRGYDRNAVPPPVAVQDHEEAEEINQFEDGIHPMQQQGMPPMYSDDEISALMTQLAIAKACRVPHTYYSEDSALYQAAMTRMSAYPPPSMCPTYESRERLVAHQEMADVRARHTAELDTFDREYQAFHQSGMYYQPDFGPGGRQDEGGSSHPHATPLKSVLPDQIIDLDDITTKKRKKHNMLYSDTSYPERRRAVKKSKYLASPYDDAVHESTASDLQKILSSYAWSPDPDLSEHELLYYSNNKAHKYALERRDLWSLQQDEWVSCFVINAWVNCLNWNQQRDKMTRLVTPMVNYADLAKPGAFDKNNPAAFGRFIERLSKFSYLDWQTIDLNSLEYIMAPALMGDPGSHYVGFVVNLKDNKFEFLNSLKGESLYTKNGAPTMYKHMFDVWLSEVEVFVTEMYRQKNIAMPFKFTSFQWHSPTMPNQIDKCNCGIFCMKFLAEWAGDNTQMDSFKGWKRMPKKQKVARMMDLRIGICSTIMGDTSNSGRNVVEDKARKYHAAKLGKLAT
ncbi:hypothetical protein QL285_036521 [Trifolium repens]|nr:hypothetical protein QL285_036521 [Trifolium repens]